MNPAWVQQAYTAWRQGDGARALHNAIQRARLHFEAMADHALALHAHRGGSDGVAAEAWLGSTAAAFQG